MRKHIFINGRVQGVGFRHFTKVNARELGVNGWVKNLEDGRVEAVFEGEEQKVEELIDRCQKGPASGYVKQMDIQTEKEKGAFTKFKVQF